MQNIRNFFIAFAVSLVAFSAVAWGIMAKLTPDVKEENSGNEVVESTNVIDVNNKYEEPEIKGKTFTALLACADSDTGRHDAIMLLHVDKERKEYMISTLPSYMVLNIDSIEYYLGDLINEKGRSFLLDKVYAVTGMKVDYYAFVSLNGFVNVIDKLGGVTFTVPQDMYYETHDGKVLVNLKKGTQKLSGSKALELLRFKGYSDGDTERRNVQRDFILTAFDTLLDASNMSAAPAVFDEVFKHVNTNFSATDFMNNIDLIFNYDNFEKIEIDYPGFTNENDEVVRFIPEIDDAIEAYKNHR